MRISSRAALACLLSLFVLGTAAMAEEVDVRFVHQGTVLTNVKVTMTDGLGATLSRMPIAADGVYSVNASLGEKLHFSVYQPLTGQNIAAEAYVSQLGAIIDIDLTQPEAQQVANDECANAVPIAVPSLTAGATIGATTDNAYPLCGTAVTSPGVWYTFTGTGTDLLASTCSVSSGGSADYDTKISIYCLDCDPAAVVCVGGNDDDFACSDFTSSIAFATEAGSTYFVLVHGYGGSTGNFNLDLIDSGVPSTGAVGCVPPPPTGACCDCNAAPFNCEVLTEDDCSTRGGMYFGDDTVCFIPDPNPVTYASAPGLDFGGSAGQPSIISDTITVPDSGVITDVNIQLEILHTWIGDMSINIEHLGVVQTIWDNRCGSTVNFNATADDEGTESYCAPLAAGPADAVFYMPEVAGLGPLSVFDGLDMMGDWTLTIEDTWPSLDDGRLTAWAVILPGAPTLVCPDQNDGTCFLCGVGDDEDEDGEGGGGNQENRDLTTAASDSSANTQLSTGLDFSVDETNNRGDRTRKVIGR